MDPDRENVQLVSNVGEVSDRCAVCRASDKAPHVPIVGARAVSKFNGNLQDGITALHAMDGNSKYSLPVPLLSGNPREVRDAACGAWTRVFGQPQSILAWWQLVGFRGSRFL